MEEVSNTHETVSGITLGGIDCAVLRIKNSEISKKFISSLEINGLRMISNKEAEAINESDAEKLISGQKWFKEILVPRSEGDGSRLKSRVMLLYQELGRGGLINRHVGYKMYPNHSKQNNGLRWYHKAIPPILEKGDIVIITRK